MAAKLNSARIDKTNANSYPVTETVDIKDCISLSIKVSGANSVSYKFIQTGNTGIIEPNSTIIVQFANSDAITDKIDFTFNGASNVLVDWTTGIAGSSSGSATAANQVILLNYVNGSATSVLSGNFEITDFIEYLADNSTDVCLGCSIYFEGSGGELKGVTVPDKFIVSYSGTMRNQVNAIAFKVPTIPNAAGNQRVLVGYTKL
jgi:hypothetical protein